MKVEKFLLHSFEEGISKSENVILVPEGSIFLQLSMLHDGIYAWYQVTELIADSKEEKFAILKTNGSVPDNADFVQIIDTIVDTPQGQAIVIFPIYKLK